MSDQYSPVCDLCEKPKEEFRVERVGISFGMAGNHYDFCKDCLQSTTADEFWEKMFVNNNYSYPPVLLLGRDESF
jgi:hypothetical protein